MSPSNMYNPKPREVWCPQCKEYTVRDDPGPTCKNPECNGRDLFTVVYSSLTSKRLTGNELAK